MVQKFHFESQYFDVIVSNSVLEHIENVQEVLNDVGRVIKKNGQFLFCVPNTKAFDELSIAKFFEKNSIKKTCRILSRLVSQNKLNI